MRSVLQLHRWDLFRLATFFNHFFKQRHFKLRVLWGYMVYPRFIIKNCQPFPPPAQLWLWCLLTPLLLWLPDPERSRRRRRSRSRPESLPPGGADIAAGLTAAAGTAPPGLIKFQTLNIMRFSFLNLVGFFEAKKWNPKTSETKDTAKELAVDRGSEASQVD